MQRFDCQSKAMEHARQGGQGVYVADAPHRIPPPGVAEAPRGRELVKVVRELSRRGRAAVLYDRNGERLLGVMRRCGAIMARINRLGKYDQHVFLVGQCAERLIRLCDAEGPA